MLAERITRYAESLSEGVVLATKGLLRLGGRAAVDQALSRLAREGTLMRIGRGRYVLPIANDYGGRSPETHKVIEALERQIGEPIVPHGIVAANGLGLTTQVPVRETYMTAGRPFELSFGKRVVKILHVPRWQVIMPHRSAGNAVRAIAWLGQEHAQEALLQIRATFPEEEWQALVGAGDELPTWIAQAVNAMCNT